MILDLLEQTRLPLPDCDVCVLGGGPAGITLALTLARARPDWQIVLAEGGGDTLPTPDENDAYQADSGGPSDYPLPATRLRFLGGTSNHWGGWCRPLDPEDFAARAWLPHSGWPIARDALLPYYARAADWCEIGSSDYDADAHLANAGERVLDLGDTGMLCHKLFRFSPPTRFGERYREDLATADNLHCWLHANAVGLTFGDGRVERVRLDNGAGVAGELRARHVVVAMGGVETARFLLCHEGRGGAGSGLSSPMLGRCFADHLGFAPARVLLPARLDYGRIAHESGPVMPVLALRADAQREFRLPNVSLTPLPLPAMRQLDADYPHNPVLGFRGGDYWNYQLQVVLEPQPNPDSRITLGDEHDRFGLPRLRLDWRIHDGDRKRGNRLIRALAKELGASGLGRVRPLSEERAFDRLPTFVSHHMGATRMADTVEAGVVDRDCRVHGFDNLHVASSSVFPAFGFSNPTLTIVALNLRLAERLAAATNAREQG